MSGRSGVSDSTLGLTARWFTGKQWADGMAEYELRREFEQAFQEFHKQKRHAHAHRSWTDGLDFDAENLR
jgi:hypothetical protein